MHTPEYCFVNVLSLCIKRKIVLKEDIKLEPPWIEFIKKSKLKLFNTR